MAYEPLGGIETAAELLDNPLTTDSIDNSVLSPDQRATIKIRTTTNFGQIQYHLFLEAVGSNPGEEYNYESGWLSEKMAQNPAAYAYALVEYLLIYIEDPEVVELLKVVDAVGP